MAWPDSQHRSRVSIGALLFIATLLGAFALKLTRPITAPLALAFLSALVLHPIRVKVSRRMPRRLEWVGVLAAVMLMVLAILGLGGAVALAVAQASDELPKHADRFSAILEPIRSWAKQHGLMGGGSSGGGGGSLLQGAAGAAKAAVAAMSGALGFVLLAVFFVTLMLSEVGQWREKVLRVMRRDDAGRVLDAVAASASGVRHYLVALTATGLLTAIVEGVFMFSVGVKLALVWALLFFILNYVPYIGSLVAAIPPVLFVLATQGLQRGLLVALGIAVIEQIMGNLVAPIIQGRETKLSPLVVLAAITFWGWVWGVIGALLAVPVTVTIMMLCSRIPSLERVAVLLGREQQQG